MNYFALLIISTAFEDTDTGDTLLIVVMNEVIRTVKIFRVKFSRYSRFRL